MHPYYSLISFPLAKAIYFDTAGHWLVATGVTISVQRHIQKRDVCICVSENISRAHVIFIKWARKKDFFTISFKELRSSAYCNIVELGDNMLLTCTSTNRKNFHLLLVALLGDIPSPYLFTKPLSHTPHHLNKPLPYQQTSVLLFFK